MKLLLTIVLIALAHLSTAHAVVKVFACEPEWKALADAIGGERVDTFSATTAFQNPHYIEARPSLIARTRQADLLVCTGAELEIGWLPLLLRQSGNAAIQQGEPGHFLAALQVERIEVPTELDRSQGDVHASGNPHVHWDPYRLASIAEALSARLQKIDPEGTAYYQQRLETFLSEWNAAIAGWESAASGLRGKKAIVYHKSWSYLLNWLQVDVVGDIEPKPGIPPTSAHLANLLKAARANSPDFILITNYQHEKGALWLSDKTGVPVLQLPYTIGGSEQATSLRSLYDDVLSRMLQGR